MLALILKGLGTRESSAVGCGEEVSMGRGVLKLCPPPIKQKPFLQRLW